MTTAPASATTRVLEAKDYAEFHRTMAESGCDRCALAAGRTNIVVDRGNPSAKVLVIGEAPGRNEDLQGRAFIGQAGKLFDKVTAEAGLDSDRDMLICNVVKCRPPDNRPPRPEEAAACRPFLEKQLSLAGPKVVVLLGASALKYVDAGKKNFAMSEEAGKFFRLAAYPGVSFVVFYHPAALLYNRKLLPEMQKHAAALKALAVAQGALS